jgi:CheY-like chemotaxis protein
MTTEADIRLDHPPDRNLNLLLVDDNRGDEILIREALKESNLGTTLKAVKSGQEAISFLRREAGPSEFIRPDVVILDLYLNGQSGHDVLQLIRQEGQFKNIPVLMFTSLDCQRQRDVCAANAYIVKYWDIEKYMSVVRAVERYWINLLMLSPRPPREDFRMAS